MELVDESNEELRAKLRLVAELSRSAMWELRHPIDGGQIFRGEELGDVLEAHAATFTVISSVPAELVQQGRETPLSIIDRSLLFSIAHNALTNVIRHANASEVVIGLDCDGEKLRLGSRDETGGCQACVATVAEDGSCRCPTAAGGCRRTTRPGVTGSGTCGPTPSGWAGFLRCSPTGTAAGPP